MKIEDCLPCNPVIQNVQLQLKKKNKLPNVGSEKTKIKLEDEKHFHFIKLSASKCVNPIQEKQKYREILQIEQKKS